MKISKLEYVKMQIDLLGKTDPRGGIIGVQDAISYASSFCDHNGITVAEEPEFFGSPFSEKEFKELMDAAGVPCGVKRDFLHLNLKKRGLVIE